MTQAMTKSTDWDALWLAARERMRRDMGDAVFDAWIRPLSFVSADGTELKIGALTPFARNWVASHHLQRIERALSGESGVTVTIGIIVAPQRPGHDPVPTLHEVGDRLHQHRVRTDLQEHAVAPAEQIGDRRAEPDLLPQIAVPVPAVERTGLKKKK